MPPVKRPITLSDTLFERAERLTQDPTFGFESFNDVVIEALSQFLVSFESPETEGTGQSDPTLGATQDTGNHQQPGASKLESVSQQLDDQTREVLEAASVRPENLSDTAIRSVRGARAFEPDDPIPAGDDEPLFGLHNRDYPSIWVLQWLAFATKEGPISYSQFAWAIDLAAQRYRQGLRDFDKHKRREIRIATMFPGSRKSVKEASWNKAPIFGKAKTLRAPFPKHALGRVQTQFSKEDRRSTRLARGALPQWDAMVFEADGADYLIGPTEFGIQLLRDMKGLSLSLPHSEELTRAFFTYLGEHSRVDASAFELVLSAVAKAPNRYELLGECASKLDPTQATNPSLESKRGEGTVQGYVSRAREWGLIDAGLDQDRRYRLTARGSAFLKNFF